MEDHSDSVPPAGKFAQINVAQSVIAPFVLGTIIALGAGGPGLALVAILAVLSAVPFLIGFLASLRWKRFHPVTYFFVGLGMSAAVGATLTGVGIGVCAAIGSL